MNEPQPISPRQRLQALLAIPERQRTDAEWDEINELEITLTPINREARPEQRAPRNNAAQANSPASGNGGRDKKPSRKLHKRPPRAGDPKRTA